MADVAGNLAALLESAKRIGPPGPGRDAPTLDQNETRAPFVSLVVPLLITYQTGITGVAKVPIQPCYGVTFDLFGTAGHFVAFALSANDGANSMPDEWHLFQGQSFCIPRGARNIYMRASLAGSYRLTFWADRWAYKRT